MIDAKFDPALTSTLRAFLARLDTLDAERRGILSMPKVGLNGLPPRRLAQIDSDTHRAERELAKLIKTHRDRIYFMPDGSIEVATK